MSTDLFAGVELGGTKCVCVLGTGRDDIRAQERLPTRSPDETLAAIEALIEGWSRTHGPLAAIGLASFGPLDLDSASATFGDITTTPKPGWSGTSLGRRFAERFRVPIGLHTDVNGAALAEGCWGAARGLRNHAYVTVGTGVGVGLILNGEPILGCHHPEMGHLRIRRADGDAWSGHCAYHGDCVEGLASGPAIQARTGKNAHELPDDHLVWSFVVDALAQLLHALVLTTAPQRIVLGGGVVGNRPALYTRIRGALRQSLNDYVRTNELSGGLEQYVVPPGLGGNAGALGALVLAQRAASRGGQP